MRKIPRHHLQKPLKYIAACLTKKRKTLVAFPRNQQTNKQTTKWFTTRIAQSLVSRFNRVYTGYVHLLAQYQKDVRQERVSVCVHPLTPHAVVVARAESISAKQVSTC